MMEHSTSGKLRNDFP